MKRSSYHYFSGKDAERYPPMPLFGELEAEIFKGLMSFGRLDLEDRLNEIMADVRAELKETKQEVKRIDVWKAFVDRSIELHEKGEL